MKLRSSDTSTRSARPRSASRRLMPAWTSCSDATQLVGQRALRRAGRAGHRRRRTPGPASTVIGELVERVGQRPADGHRWRFGARLTSRRSGSQNPRATRPPASSTPSTPGRPQDTRQAAERGPGQAEGHLGGQHPLERPALRAPPATTMRRSRASSRPAGVSRRAERARPRHGGLHAPARWPSRASTAWRRSVGGRHRRRRGCGRRPARAPRRRRGSTTSMTAAPVTAPAPKMRASTGHPPRQYSTLTMRLSQNEPTASMTTPMQRQHQARPVGELADVVGVHDGQQRGQQQRQGHQHVGGEPALGAERLDLARDPVALADRGGDVVEDLGQVAADLAVDLDGLGHPLEVLAAHPLGRGPQRRVEVAAQAGLDDDPAELVARRRLGLPGDDVERLEDAVARAQRAGHELEVVAQLRRELAPGGGWPAREQATSARPGPAAARTSPRRGRRAGPPRASAAERDGAGQHDDLAGPQGDAGPLEGGVQAAAPPWRSSARSSAAVTSAR